MSGDWGWVGTQLALFGAIGGAWLVGPPVSPLGFVPAAVGAALAAWAAVTMGRSLSPFPTPSRDAELVDWGPFRIVRHPIYLGGVLFFGGLSLVFSAWGLLGTGVLALFWLAKARVEERRLMERFPEYAAYRRRTLI